MTFHVKSYNGDYAEGNYAVLEQNITQVHLALLMGVTATKFFTPLYRLLNVALNLVLMWLKN